MSNSNSAAARPLDQFQSPTDRGATTRTRPVLVADLKSVKPNRIPVSQEEALRQAILRTG
ncbi:MAG: hypothetical protein AB8B97_28055 [Granulosicoccus sp.]